ncbi:acyltransferase [Dysgonomonas sp. 520]|uniref:acyltransferase family protein n=1 Tax=Dysgonomonas sp. 520 TaxID=2302931 RepID=UPI0013D0B18B|nr:acyltransferase [Dysgonomonas sp. 520]NDW10154.1 acyltransferase [Dysgonomonas sp. 520]
MKEIEKKTHFYWLDLVRCLAALIVVLTHHRIVFFVEYGSLPSEDQNLFSFIFYFITRLGHVAVLIFFVLSGFLVGGKGIQRIKEGTFDLKSYTIDRAVRIMLPLISALVLVFISNLITGVDNNILIFVGNFFSLQGILVKSVSEPFWSLSYEVWFYIGMGAVALWFISKNNKQKIISLIIIFVCFIIFGIYLKASYLFVWMLAALFYFNVKRNNIILTSSILLLIVSIVVFQISVGSRTTEYAGSLNSVFLNENVIELFIALFACIMIQQIIQIKPSKKISILINKFATNFAKFSYTLYLTHMPILRMLEYFGFPKSERFNATSIGYYCLSLAISILGAYLLYLLFEKQTSRVKQMIKKQTT